MIINFPVPPEYFLKGGRWCFLAPGLFTMTYAWGTKGHKPVALSRGRGGMKQTFAISATSGGTALIFIQHGGIQSQTSRRVVVVLVM